MLMSREGLSVCLLIDEARRRGRTPEKQGILSMISIAWTSAWDDEIV